MDLFGAAAERARAGGYDMVQVHAAHGFLLNSFISPFINKRTDEFGGSLENRMRFLLGVIEKIKEHYLKNEGFTFIEKDDIDLVVETIDNRLAIQVETGKSDIQANLTKLGRYRADCKFVVTTNPETEIIVKERLKELIVPDRENIHITFVKDFLKDPFTL